MAERVYSLQVTWIRNTILHALRSAATANVHTVPQNFVYNHPTITSLAQYVSSLASKSPQENQDLTNETVERMRTLLDKYSAGLEPKYTDNEDPSSAAGNTQAVNGLSTVMVTGTTGRLGSYLLAQLLARPDIAHVYALNRVSRSSTSLMARSEEAFQLWGLDVTLLHSGKVSLYTVDLAQLQFGLGEAVYDEMRKSVTHIIHNGKVVHICVWGIYHF